MSQGDLFGGIKAKDRAIDKVVSNADQFWINFGALVGAQIARDQEFFTSADIDLQMMARHPDVKTHDKRAMTGVMARLKKEKMAVPTSEFIQDPRPNCHAQNKRVWRSLIYWRRAA